MDARGEPLRLLRVGRRAGTMRHFESSVELRRTLRNVKVQAGRQAIESIQVLCYRSRFLFCSV